MLELKGVSKIFPSVKALNRVSLQFEPGEVHALLGENGAGKSTLIKIVSGIYEPDEGEVWLDGKKLSMHSYKDAVSNNISIVNQEIQVIPKSTIAENIILDRLDQFSVAGIVNWKKINNLAQKYLDIVGLDLPPSMLIENLSAAQKQLVQIAKALSANARVLLLDEPTSSLTNHESKNLFSIINKLKQDGTVLIFVSHKLEEVLEICDKISVLRDGQHVGTRSCENLEKSEIVKMMIGRDIVDINMGRLNINSDINVFEVQNLSQKGTFTNLSFNLRKGEILGFYGLVGSGRTELAKILIGEDKMDSGSIKINDKLSDIRSMSDSLNKYKIGYVSENRKEEGLILEESVKTNIGITIWNQITQGPFRKISLKQENTEVQKMIDLLKIKVSDQEQPVSSLSGGNQQKVSISKWLAAGCDILIIDEPSVGVDVGAKQYIHNLIWELARDQQKSIILISSDMPELCKLSRRILVFKEFNIIGEIDDISDRDVSYQELSSRIGAYLA